MASPSPSSSHPSRTSRPSRPRLRVGLVCLCSAALLAVSALPNARASNLAGHELPQGVDWAVGDGVEVMTSSWTAGSSLGRRAVGALVDETDSDATHSRHSSSSRRVTAKATGSDVVDIRMAATAASVESVETSTITEAAAGETSAGVQAAAATTTITRTASASSAIPTSTAVPAGYQLPEAFDSTLGTNFTGTACPSFFKTFLADPTFTSCAPFSLLLATSSAFFTAERSPYSLLPFVLDASCTASNITCSDLMSQLAAQIRLGNTCGPDLAKGNPLVTEALAGFQSYNLYREAGCQRSNSTDRYCFAEASAKSDPDELYFYYLPEGTSLPSGTKATCDSCTKGLLQIYSKYAINSTLPISKTYAAGRSLANQACGPTFAPLVSTSTSGAPRRMSVSLSLSLGGLAVGIFAVSGW